MSNPGPKVCYLASLYRSHRRAAHDNMRALAAAGIRVVDEPADADVVVIHDEPWTYPGYFRAFPEMRERHVVAYAVWEPDVLPPDMIRWIGLANEVWTCSSFCRDILAAVGRPTTVVPHIVEAASTPNPDLDAAVRQRLGVAEDSFVFYSIGRLEERKNMEAGIRAFAAAFPEGGASYVVKTALPLPENLLNVKGVIRWEGNPPDAEIAALHRIGHCLISSHCSEGWGLCLSDAMAEGNLVIATGYSGNTEFMDDTNGILAAFTLDRIRRPETRSQFGFPPESTTAKWAYVDEADLASAMRNAYADWQATAPLRERARDVSRRFSEGHVGSIMAARLAGIGSARNPPSDRKRAVQLDVLQHQVGANMGEPR